MVVVKQGGGNGGDEQQKTQSRHSHSHHHHHHGSSKPRHSSSSHSRDEKKKYDRKELKEKAKIEKAKIEKYEQKIKSKDKLKSDKYQDLDIFSNTKKLGTLHLPTVRSPSSSSGSSTPNTPKTHKKEFEKKLDEEIRKELERREEKRKERHHHSDKHFKTPVRMEERRDSSDKERSSEKKERRSSKDDRHDSHSSRHRHDSDRKHKDRRHSSSSSSSSSGEKKEKDRRSSTDYKYSKEREQQEMESKRRLQDARLKREREEKEKSRSHEKEKSAKEGENNKHSKLNFKEREKSNQKPDDDINVLLKEKISSLGVDNIQKMLMESLVEKTGAKVSDEEKQKMMAKMENIIKEKKPATKKSPVSKPSPKKKSVTSSSSSSGPDSDDEIKEMKLKMKKSKAGPVSRPVRNRKVRKFEVEEDKSDSDGDFVAPVDSEETKTPTVVKFMKKNLSPVGPGVVKKPDDDPDMPDFNCFADHDVEKSERISEKLKQLLANEDKIDIGEITEADINDAIQPSRLVEMDLDEGSDPKILIEKLALFGGNPRLTTPVPDWLNPYLKGAKVKIEDVEMPTIDEVRQHLLKKKTGKRKRGAGWDIVVDWVPQEQPAGKRSKIEKELGFDFDSSFGCSLSGAEGRRSRRSNTKLNTSQDQQTVVEKDQKTKSDPEVEEKPVEETAQVSASPDSPAAAEDRAEVNLEEVSTSEAANTEDGSPSKKRRSKDIIAAYLNSAGVERNLMEADENTKVLAILNEKIKEAELELKSVLKTLQQSKNKRKRAAFGENKVNHILLRKMSLKRANFEIFFILVSWLGIQ